MKKTQEKFEGHCESCTLLLKPWLSDRDRREVFVDVRGNNDARAVYPLALWEAKAVRNWLTKWIRSAERRT